MIYTDRKLTFYQTAWLMQSAFSQTKIWFLIWRYCRRLHWTIYVSRNGSNNLWESIGSFVPCHQKGNWFMTDCPILTQNLPACKFLAKERILQMLNNDFCIRTLRKECNFGILPSPGTTTKIFMPRLTTWRTIPSTACWSVVEEVGQPVQAAAAPTTNISTDGVTPPRWQGPRASPEPLVSSSEGEGVSCLPLTVDQPCHRRICSTFTTQRKPIPHYVSEKLDYRVKLTRFRSRLRIDTWKL